MLKSHYESILLALTNIGLAYKMTYRYILLLSLFLLNTGLTAAPLTDPTMPAYYKAKHTAVADVIMPNDSRGPVWVLNTTLIDPYRKIAIINGQQLVIGDEINEAELVEISHQHVKLRYKNKLITINLQRSFISQIKSK